MNAVVVTFDRLPESFLGCYGNGWIDTPNFDRLSAQSTVFHQHFAEQPDGAGGRHAWWSGRYECRRHSSAAGETSLLALLRESGVTPRLLIEAAQSAPPPAAGMPIDSEFSEIIWGADGLDVAVDETPFLRLVARAQRDLRLLRTSRSEPWLLWVKSRGVPSPWLAPRDLASRYFDVADEDEDADENEQESEGPGGELVEMSTAEFDDLLRFAASVPQSDKGPQHAASMQRALARKACGGYVSLLDAGLERLLEHVDQGSGGSPMLLIVAAAAGATVRRAGTLSGEWAALADEVMHAPLFVRHPGGNRGSRSQALVQTVDLAPTLGEWFGVDLSSLALEGQSLLPLARGENSQSHPFAYCGCSAGLAGIRTPHHYLVTRRVPAGEPADRRLFLKPEDIWEINDQAAQSPDVVEQLAAELDRFFAAGDHAA